MSPPTLLLSRRAQRSGPSPISDLMSRALSHPQLISLAAGFVDPETLPVDEVRAALDDLLGAPESARAALQYGTTHGDRPLRAALVEHWLASEGDAARGRDIDLEQVVVTAGSNQLLHLATEALCDEGDLVLCAAPTYFVYLGLLEQLGVQAVGVATDEQGLVPAALDATLAELDRRGELPRVKAVYVVSYFDNPQGTTLAAERRPQLLEIVRRWSRHGRIVVLEDAAYRDLSYAPDPPPASLWSHDPSGEWVVLASTFSKSFSPGLRVGWGALPRELADRVARMKGSIDFGSANFNQQLLQRVLASGRWRPHVERLRRQYAHKLATMLEAAETHLATIPGVRWRRPQGGLYVWLELPEGLSAGLDGPLFDLALNEGVLYVPGVHCYPQRGEPARANTLRLSFGVQPPAGIAAGMATLGRAIRQALAG